MTRVWFRLSNVVATVAAVTAIGASLVLASAPAPTHDTAASSQSAPPYPPLLYRKMPLLGAAGQLLAHSVTASATRPRQVVPMAGRPYPCTSADSGDRWTDPDTNEELVCQCFYHWEEGQLYDDCEWILVTEDPHPTWINLNSGLYMDVEGASQNNGARIHQWAYTGAANQRWGMHTSTCGCGPGFVNSTSTNSEKCLGVQGSSLSQGASILQWDCNRSPSQTWLWVYTGYTTSTGWPIWDILDEHSGMCLGISGASTAVGAYAIQLGCDGNADQGWY